MVRNTDKFVWQPTRFSADVFSMLNNADLFIHNLIGPFIWQAFLAVIYLGWLASWWFRQQKQSSSGIVESPSQSPLYKPVHKSSMQPFHL